MTDVHSKETRSYNMSRVKSKNTKPEMLLRKELFKRGFRYRLHDKKLPGKPDIILPKFKTVIFVNGCFWHGHEGCRYYTIPKTRTEWWQHKITGNIARDSRAMDELIKLGWGVITIWTCELKKNTLEDTVISILKNIKSNCSQ
ncbi:DNA mismatch endonuclease Vsr [Pontibacter qinzhouensis]|uniref:Very short patch repair endonuclease n=1 Tax=Pontibacter qinzhouensis TaxID=2603253 RepID=A0A5C8JGF6_9BACT|nr:very short patch repair endonuclease [Pontibacter qinzhouensis]TXK36461.1 DNA mismatch endonuclease Vsr [Pontibacter qinzhouensis]